MGRMLIALGFVLIFGLLLGRGMLKRLDHDEHQFVASGALLARQRAIPYRDYPYFHMPYLVFIYGMIYKLSDHLLLAARLVSIACECLTVLLASWIAYRAHRGQAIADR